MNACFQAIKNSFDQVFDLPDIKQVPVLGLTRYIGSLSDTLTPGAVPLATRYSPLALANHPA